MKRLRKFIVATLVSPMAIAAVTPSRADDFVSSTSIRLAPVDADFYSATYRMKEQWDNLIAGPVVKKLLALPVVEENWEHFLEQWNRREKNVANLRMALENPNAKEALQFLKELASDECFAFGDKKLGSFVRAYTHVSNAVNELVSQGATAPEELSSRMLNLWIDELEKMEIPIVVFGAKCKDEDLAITKVDQLEATLQLSMGFTPQLSAVSKSLKRIEDARGSRLTLELNGDMIPWDSFPLPDTFDEESLEVLQNVLREKTIAITVGTLDNYFIVGISPKRADLMSLGKGANLSTNPDFAPVMKNTSNKLTSASYVSDNLAQANYEAQLKDFFSRNYTNISAQLLGIQAITTGRPLDKTTEAYEFIDDLRGEMKWMDESIAKFIPPARGSTGYTFMTPSGWEQMILARTKNVLLDSSKPLKGLQHVGGDPMMMVVTRLQDRPEYFGLVRQIVQRIKKQLDRAFKVDWSDLGARPQNLDEAHAEVEKIWPLLVKLADAWEKKFLPAMDGEHGIVMSSGNLSSKQWAKDMPASDEPLPLPEITWRSGIREAEKFKDGVRDVFSVCDSVLEYIRTKDPNAIPANYTIPRPTQVQSSDGVKYGIPIPDDCPVPKSMMPHCILSGSYLVAGFSEMQSGRITQATPLKSGAQIIDAGKPLANASYVHIGRIMKAIKPWVVYGLKQGVKDLDDPLQDPNIDELEGYSITANDFVDLWSVFETVGAFSSTTEIDSSDVTVTRAVYSAQNQ